MWEHGSHLIASSVPVEPAGGDASHTEEEEEEIEEEKKSASSGQMINL